MNLTRRELYALGEPIGQSCTQAKPGSRGRVYGGGGGGSSSSSTNQTFNTDKRLITGEGSIGLSLDDSLSLINLEDNDSFSSSLTDSRSFSSSSADVLNSNNTTNNTTNITTLDQGAISSAFGTTNNALTTIGQAVANAFDFGSDTTSRALQTVEMNNATLGDGFERLLDAADSLFERGENLIGQTGDRVADAYRTATVEKSGTIDNRTITVIAVAGAVALIAMNARK